MLCYTFCHMSMFTFSTAWQFSCWELLCVYVCVCVCVSYVPLKASPFFVSEPHKGEKLSKEEIPPLQLFSMHGMFDEREARLPDEPDELAELLRATENPIPIGLWELFGNHSRTRRPSVRLQVRLCDHWSAALGGSGTGVCLSVGCFSHRASSSGSIALIFVQLDHYQRRIRGSLLHVCVCVCTQPAALPAKAPSVFGEGIRIWIDMRAAIESGVW